MRLYHYTCRDGERGIDHDGFVRPNAHPFLPKPLVWATDLATPYREPLGLTSFSLSCDRTEVCYEVATEGFVPWVRWARDHVHWSVREELESAPGVMPRHWWVSEVAAEVVVKAKRAVA